MQIVLSGALPDPAEARELIRYMQDTAPTLCQWLGLYQAQEHTVDPSLYLCTPAEHYALQQAKFHVHQAQHLSAGLAPLLLQRSKIPLQQPLQSPIWLAQLVHIAPSRDGAMLVPARELMISTTHSQALFDSFAPFLADTGFTFSSCTSDHWQVQVPSEFTTAAASPELVASSNVNNWWTQDQVTRPWRKLANEFQMFSFGHPVNIERQQQGLLPINSLWLYGGGSIAQLAPSPETSSPVKHLDQLQASFQSRDWGDWLVQLKQLENELFAKQGAHPPERLVLLGRERYIICTLPQAKPWPLRLFSKPQPWSRWWSPLS